MKKWMSPDAERYLGLGLQLAVSVLLGFFVGFYIDRRFETLPWFTLGGFSVGLIAGFAGFIYQLKGLKSNEDE